MGLPGDEKTPIAQRVKLPAQASSLAWRVRVKRSGDYLLWMRVRSRTKEARLTISADGKTVAESMRSPLLRLAARAYGWIVRQRVRMNFYGLMPEVRLIKWALANS